MCLTKELLGKDFPLDLHHDQMVCHDLHHDQMVCHDLHRGLHLFSGGVMQSGVSSPACEFAASTGEEFCEFLSGGPIPFNHITFTGEATMVKSYTLPYAETP